MNRLDDIRHGLDADAEYDDEDTIPISIGDVRWLVAQVADLLAALEEIASASEDWTATDTGFSRLAAIADRALAAAHQGEEG